MPKTEKKFKILVIEDDKLLKKIYQTKLAIEGYDAVIASNGEEGLEMAKEFKPDLILLDLLMPIKTGFEVLEDISKNKTLKSIPIIVATNLGQEADRQRISHFGVKDYIIKSDITIQGIIDKISNILK